MNSRLKLIILAGLLVSSVIICAIRWKAWFVSPVEQIWESDSIKVSFSTFADEQVVQNLQRDTLEFILLGDIHNSLETTDFNRIYEYHPRIDFYVQLGDWMERPYFYYEQMMYQSIKDTEFEKLPIIAIPGNHEYNKGIIKRLFSSWTNIFPNPKNGPIGFLGRTYIVDFPTLRFIAIDTDGLHHLSDYMKVNFWLKKSLREATDKLTIVVMHHPVFSTAKGRQNILLWMNFYGALREADVVFSGHDHNYARRSVEYKERFWSKQQPTLFIGTNASHKNYPNKEKSCYDYVFSGSPIYEYIQVKKDKLYIRTYEIQSGKLIDEVELVN